MEFSFKKKEFENKRAIILKVRGKKLPKNPKISWVLPNNGISLAWAELIYSDFAKHYSADFSSEKTSMEANVQFFWTLWGKTPKKCEKFVSFPQKLDIFWLGDLWKKKIIVW